MTDVHHPLRERLAAALPELRRLDLTVDNGHIVHWRARVAETGKIKRWTARPDKETRCVD